MSPSARVFAKYVSCLAAIGLFACGHAVDRSEDQIAASQTSLPDARAAAQGVESEPGPNPAALPDALAGSRDRGAAPAGPPLSDGLNAESDATSTSSPELGVQRHEAYGAGSVSALSRGAAHLSLPEVRGVYGAPEFSTEQYAFLQEEGFVSVADRALSTFSIDVDTASYSNVRRFINSGARPPSGAVRIEELINYFSYDYPAPQGDDPFSVTTEVARAPWNPKNKLVLVGLRGRDVETRDVPARNIVFLIDVSGSMQPTNKLPLVKHALSELARQMRPKDHVAIVVYAGASGCVLAPTSGVNKQTILDALANLQAGGSTNGADGIRLAYDLAAKHFDRDGINRVILATDGDFNVGTTSESELVELIEEKRKGGVFLTVLGVGMGNLKDATMEKLADHGNGNYAYLDTPAEARKVLIEQASGTLMTIAKDVKIQVEFNPVHVKAYRLIGYENRRLQAKDFNDDSKDAGEIGAGHTVTALYEVVPSDGDAKAPSVDPLRYQKPGVPTHEAQGGELLTVKLRYKQPDGDTSKLLSRAVQDAAEPIEKASTNLRFAAGVAVFGMVLGGSEERGTASYDMALGLARDALGGDPNAYRAEFLRIVAMARDLDMNVGGTSSR